MSRTLRSCSSACWLPVSRSAIVGSTTLPPSCTSMDRTHELVALRDPVLQEVGEAAVALPEQRDGVLGVVVRGEDHHAGVGVLLPDRVRAVDPLELERRRHLDVGDDDVGHVFAGRRHERRRVRGDADHLDVVVGVEQRANTLADQHVVLAEHHPDRHVAAQLPVYDAAVLRIVFAEDNYLVREGTAALLHEAGDVEIVGTAASYDELLAAVADQAPDAVLTDIRMPPTGTDEGIRAARQIRADHPDTGVVVLSQYADEAYVYDLLKDGAAGLGYLLKERVADLDEVVRALHEVSRGGSVLDPKVVESLVAAKDRLAHSPLAQLTDREREVLSLMAQGMNNASIAKALFLTDRAVEKHINSMFHKLGLTEEPDVHRRVMAVLAFLRETELA